MPDEFPDYPEFQLRLPYGGPRAHGRLLPEMGTNGSQKFKILAGSPVRPEVMPSFPKQMTSSNRLRESLIAAGTIGPSPSRSEYLETTRDIVCNSPSAAAEVLLGRAANGWKEWITEDGRPLGEFVEAVWPGPNRTWLVRGADVAGYDLVQRLWLPEGVVSLPATNLRTGVKQGASKEQLRTFVDEDYGPDVSYGQKQQLVEELHAFLSRMKPGDTVCTVSGGDLHVGKVAGSVRQDASDAGRHNLIRPAEWQDTAYPAAGLPEELRQRLSIQGDLVDLTAVAGLVAALGRTVDELVEEAAEPGSDPTIGAAAHVTTHHLDLPDPTDQLAAELLVPDVGFLRELRDLLRDERQLVLQGTPGTGKTYLALQLAEFFAGAPERVTLVQFHPSYSYEDFFEGFRPKEDEQTKEVAFRLVNGPLRDLADAAGLEANRHLPYFLVIDEMNRANLAKVFGELYFLLEYRTRAVRLTYSNKVFLLPSNLFIIGTMNTADRSIALLDSAMRRRFAFVELSPRTEPTHGLLRRWLAHNGHGTEAADLHEALNRRITDPAFLVGPSYLMKKAVYEVGGLERTWRTKILPLLDEHHYGEGVDVEQHYGLEAMRADLASRAAAGTGSP